ncbi:MAG: beta-propeller domain-containing protein [Microthrixaceae bacterium]
MSEARLTVLDTEGTLDEVASLGDMGIGEQVQSVRFLDDIAYLVTFRQVDPLYAVDLSDPRAPRLLGELKIPGFSEYLHPVGDGLLLGVGRQVDPSSGMDQGLKISLFDMADPTRPAELDQIVLPGASSEVSNDHRAFLWDPNRRQAVIPTELSGCDDFGRCASTPGGAALVVEAGRDGLSENGRIVHDTGDGWSLQPTRSVVVDDDLWTVSIAALGRTDADSPTGVQLLPF